MRVDAFREKRRADGDPKVRGLGFRVSVPPTYDLGVKVQGFEGNDLGFGVCTYSSPDFGFTAWVI